MYDKTNAPRNVVAAFALRWEHVRRHVAATFRGDKSLRVYRSGDNLLGATLRGDKSLRVCWWIHVQIFVLAGNKSHKFSLFDFVRLVAATEFCCGRTNIFTKISSTHGAICRCDVSAQRVATTCHLVCSDLKDPGKQSRFQGISSFWEQGWLRRGDKRKRAGVLWEEVEKK